MGCERSQLQVAAGLSGKWGCAPPPPSPPPPRLLSAPVACCSLPGRSPTTRPWRFIKFSARTAELRPLVAGISGARTAEGAPVTSLPRSRQGHGRLKRRGSDVCCHLCLPRRALVCRNPCHQTFIPELPPGHTHARYRARAYRHTNTHSCLLVTSEDDFKKT